MTFPTTLGSSVDVGVLSPTSQNGQARAVSAFDAETFSRMLANDPVAGAGTLPASTVQHAAGGHPTLGDAILNGLRQFDAHLQSRWQDMSSAIEPAHAAEALSPSQLLQAQMQLAALVYETELGSAVAEKAAKNIDQIVHMQ